ncbi:hypothetical protein CDAR_619731 [Caerostris darwini]|uniref:Uncharacterized protein n=1 Tax=Caerostris darwini TaxID=1538125 RepID=A0AAV4SGM5_9ARAC|nr:hypothetical protein CDAR_619731 [Caerostris darwini]
MCTQVPVGSYRLFDCGGQQCATICFASLDGSATAAGSNHQPMTLAIRVPWFGDGENSPVSFYGRIGSSFLIILKSSAAIS